MAGAIPVPAFEGGGEVEPQDQDGGNRTFGEYLRRVREGRRLSLDIVEEMSTGFPERVTKSHLSRIENGLAYPTFTRLFALSRIYGVPITSIAERFDLALQRGMATPPTVATPEEAIEEGRKLVVSGRYAEALALFSVALEGRPAHPRDDDAPAVTLDLRLFYVDCLLHLGRYEFAKTEVEEILGHPALSDSRRLMALQMFVICCYRLGRYTVAMMALEEAQKRKGTADVPAKIWADLEAIRGNLLLDLGRVPECIAAYRAALELYQGIPIPFEACKVRVNLGVAYLDAGEREVARGHLEGALAEAEAAGYDRLRAAALSHLAAVAFLSGQHTASEALALRSNGIARPREYLAIVFRNCFYLWKIARERNDESGVKTNERTLRTYMGRIEEPMPEIEEYRSFSTGGVA
jgi:tetratricopeptide (TPR) repeat protein